MAGLDTLTNVQTQWTIDDLADAHQALQVKSHMERAARK